MSENKHTPDIDLNALHLLALSATPGPWFQVGQPWNHKGDFVCAGSEDPHIGTYVCDTEDIDGEVENSYENAAFIAAANPRTIVELLYRLRISEQQRDELLAALEKCRKELSAWMRDHGDDIATQEAVADARAAIASVKGDAA